MRPRHSYESRVPGLSELFWLELGLYAHRFSISFMLQYTSRKWLVHDEGN